MSFFFFKQKSADEMRISDWSSDVCSSDLSGRTGCNCRLTDGLPMPTARLDGQVTDIQRPLCLLQPLCAYTRRGSGKNWGNHPDRGFPAQRLGCRSDAQPLLGRGMADVRGRFSRFRRSLHPLRSEEHTSELQSLMRISYAVFCL